MPSRPPDHRSPGPARRPPGAPPRRPVTRQTYMVRRLMVLGIAALLVAGVVLATKAAFGSDASASPEASVVPTDPSTAAPTDAVVTDPATTTTVAPTTTAAAEGPFVP